MSHPPVEPTPIPEPTPVPAPVPVAPPTPAPSPAPTSAPAGSTDTFLTDLLGKYLSPGTAESLIRTWVPVAVGTALTWVLAWVAAHWHWHIVLSEHASTTVGMVSVGVVTAAYYALGRLLERRWPRLGRVLLSLGLVKARPVYAKPNEGVRIIGAGRPSSL